MCLDDVCVRAAQGDPWYVCYGPMACTWLTTAGAWVWKAVKNFPFLFGVTRNHLGRAVKCVGMLKWEPSSPEAHLVAIGSHGWLATLSPTWCG